ncbi:MAG: aminoacyl-tRNA hydrolase [bacterium]
MKLIIGLGNPGEKYIDTRHNTGFKTVDFLASQLNIETWQEKKDFNSLIAEGSYKEQKIILVKPQTFMNNSGEAVRKISGYFKVASKDIIIIHDELDLPLGEFKIQEARGAAGHNGVQSVIDNLDTNEFTRIRMGIAPEKSEQKIDGEKFVLQKFTDKEIITINQTIKKAVSKIMAEI